MYVCVCMYVTMYVCIYVCTCMYLCYECMYICMYMYMYVCITIFTCIYSVDSSMQSIARDRKIFICLFLHSTTTFIWSNVWTQPKNRLTDCFGWSIEFTFWDQSNQSAGILDRTYRNKCYMIMWLVVFVWTINYYELSTILIKCVHVIITWHSTILYRKSMKFGIQEELLLILLDIKSYWLPVKNCKMLSNEILEIIFQQFKTKSQSQ